MSAPITVASGAATDPGLRRQLNEDAFLDAAPVFLVADGMGGHDAGDLAAAAALSAFAQLRGRQSLTIDEVRDALQIARVQVGLVPEGAGAEAGTTLAGAVIAEVGGDGYWMALNVGDSRTYRLSQGMLEQISVDHSMVQELVDSGELAAEDAAKDSRRNVITRAIGAGSDGEADFWMLPAEEGDRLLICSDGLTGEVSTERITAILREEPSPQRAADRLVHEAIIRGGRDNVTVLVVDAIAVARRSATGGVQVPDGADDVDIDTDTKPREEWALGGVR